MRLSLVLLSICLLPLAACTDRADDYTDAMSREHAGDRPTPTALSTSADTTGVVTENVVYATVDGAGVTGYLARPDTAGTETPDRALPGIIVIHEWWGLNDNIRTMAERLAAEGYVALAVDLYGEEAETPEQARQLMSASMEREEALTSNVTQAYRYLETQQAADGVGVIGWCFGGGWALRTALALPNELDAAVIYYGPLVTDPDRLATLDMPILGIFGAEDEGIPVSQVRTFEQRLDSLGADAEIEVYEGAGHAFANPSGERYVAEAADDAWQKTLTFLDRHLRGSQEMEDDTDSR